jgi:hypothetical protein
VGAGSPRVGAVQVPQCDRLKVVAVSVIHLPHPQGEAVRWIPQLTRDRLPQASAARCRSSVTFFLLMVMGFTA